MRPGGNDSLGVALQHPAQRLCELVDVPGSRACDQEHAGLRCAGPLFQYGRGPLIGDKPLGVPTLLREDELGARDEVPLLDTTSTTI